MEKNGEDWRELPIFKNQPVLFKDLDWVYNGFNRLSIARQLGFSSPQPICINEVLSYCDLMGIYDPDDREDFLDYIQLLDKIFLEHMGEKAKRDKGSKAK